LGSAGTLAFHPRIDITRAALAFPAAPRPWAARIIASTRALERL